MDHKELIDSLFRERESFNRLTKQQEEAVFSKMGAVCINSGAGTGKTHVLVNRIYHLLKNKNINPEKILAVTFTNRAAGEIRRRMKDEINLSDMDTKNIRTFHSLFKEILTENISEIDQKLNKFNTINGEAKEMLVAQICGDLDISSEFTDVICSCISSLKKASSFDQKLIEISEKFKISPEKIKSAHNSYCEKLSDLRAIDFDDYEIKVLKLLRENEKIRNYWRSKFDVICIDEFQDISIEQLEIIKLLTKKDSNVFVVGDPDQSIYGFRDINSNSLFDEFLKHYQDASIVNLDQNFRSTKNILNIANKSMEKHPKHEKLYKELWTNKEEGEKVLYKQFKNFQEELDWVVKKISKMTEEEKVDTNEIAILCRNNLPTKIRDDLCMDLRMRGLDVVCTNNKDDFLNLKEIKYIVSALNLAILESVSQVHLENFIGCLWMDEKIKKTEIAQFSKWANLNNYSLSQSINFIDQCQIPKSAISILKRIGKVLISKGEKHRNDRIETIVSKLMNYEGIFNNKVIKDTKSIRNVWKLITKLKQYQGVLEIKELIKIIPTLDFRSNDYFFKTNEEEGGITISTIHKAKGLEFDYVFLIGMCSRYFPNSTKIVDIHEERRVAHVAFTRAKKQLILTCPEKESDKESLFMDSDLKSSPSLKIIE